MGEAKRRKEYEERMGVEPKVPRVRVSARQRRVVDAVMPHALAGWYTIRQKLGREDDGGVLLAQVADDGATTFSYLTHAGMAANAAINGKPLPEEIRVAASQSAHRDLTRDARDYAWLAIDHRGQTILVPMIAAPEDFRRALAQASAPETEDGADVYTRPQ